MQIVRVVFGQNTLFESLDLHLVAREIRSDQLVLQNVICAHCLLAVGSDQSIFVLFGREFTLNIGVSDGLR